MNDRDRERIARLEAQLARADEPARGAPVLCGLIRTGAIAQVLLQEELAPHGLTPQEADLLRVLGEHPGCSAGELAEHLWVERQSVQPALKRLRAAGLVASAPSETDRRAQCNELTPRARALLPRLLRVLQDVEDRVLRVVPPKDRPWLDRVLQKANDAVRFEERRRIWAVFAGKFGC